MQPFDSRFEQSFDGVLIDAPCSGLGLLGDNRHPLQAIRRGCRRDGRDSAADSRWSWLAYVAPNGVLVYANLHDLSRENERQTNHFMRAFRVFRRSPLPLSIPNNASSTPAADTQTDGFFLARMRRCQLADFTLTELETLSRELCEPKFRAKQVAEWLKQMRARIDDKSARCAS
jgi:16S rRNA (cytosine967-C5)-methyltransferase